MALSPFGLDIGRSFIKVVQIEKKGDRKILLGAGAVVTPGGGVQSESAVDLGKISDSIKNCLEVAKIDISRCVVSLTESQVISRLIELPPLTDKELSAAIHWEAEQYIPLPIKDVSLQYQVVNRPQDPSAGKMEVLLVAVPKRMIEKYLTMVKNAGLSVEAIETESQALVRALTKNDDPPTIIVSMGAVSTELVVANRGNILFTRSIASGGFNLTKAIMAEFNLPQKQAEEYKQTYGIVEDKLSGKVAAVLKPILDIIITEMLKAGEFSRGRTGDLAISRVVICGGGAFLPGLGQFLVERTSLEVSLGDPWSGFAKEGFLLGPLASSGSLYAVATGLALRS